jgi:hypothetical protein
MKRVISETVRGIAWMMGGPDGTVIAVAGERIIMRNEHGTWRTGTYLDVDDAVKNANSMTKVRELQGMGLTAGPVEFEIPKRSDQDHIIFTIIDALEL